MTAHLPRFVVSTLLLLFVAVAPAVAQDQPAVDPERAAAAKELLAAMKVQEQFHKTLDSMQNVLAGQMKAQPGGDKAVATIAKVFEPESEHVRVYLTDAEAAMTRFYAERFTAAEMKEISAFYASASGQKLQAAIPDMVQALGPPVVKFQESVKKVIMDELSAKPKQ